MCVSVECTACHSLYGDSVGGQLEVSHVLTLVSSGHRSNSVVSICRNLCTTLCPVHEVVTGVGGSVQGNFRAMGIRTCSCYFCRTSFGSGSGDGIAVNLEVSHQISCAGNGEVVCCVCAVNHRTVFCPVHEVIALVGRSLQRDYCIFSILCTRCECILTNRSGHCTVCGVICHSGDFVAIDTGRIAVVSGHITRNELVKLNSLLSTRVASKARLTSIIL